MSKAQKLIPQLCHKKISAVVMDGKRLWLGDLRLQAKVNYLTFHNTDLVKRCLYLFAGSTFQDGRVGAAVFTDDKVEVDDTYLGDYALFFISVLYDYYKETKDMDTLKDLYATAGKQVIRNYWGKMVLLGADTFWESFNPDNLEESPYGGTIANSYCHAWSCTPSMLFRTYPLL